MLTCHLESFTDIFLKLGEGALASYLIALSYLGDPWNSFSYSLRVLAFSVCLVANLLFGIPLMRR